MRAFHGALLLGAAAAAAAAAAAPPAAAAAPCTCVGAVQDTVDPYGEAPNAAVALARIFLHLAPGSRGAPPRLGAFGVAMKAAAAAVNATDGPPTCGAGVDADEAVAYAGYTVLAAWLGPEATKARALDALFAHHGFVPGRAAAGHVGAVAARKVMSRHQQGPPPAAPFKPVNPPSPGYDAACDAVVAADKWQPQCVQGEVGSPCKVQAYTPGALVNGSLFGSGGRKTVARLTAWLPDAPAYDGSLGDLDVTAVEPAGDGLDADDSFAAQHAAVLAASAELGDVGKAAADFFGPPAALRTFSLAVSEAVARELPLADAVTLFAVSAASIADAFIATQYVKARYSSVRPLTVLQCGRTPPATPVVAWAGPYAGVRRLADGERWAPYRATPGFPGYTSGHAAVAAAGSRALARVFGATDPPAAANCGFVAAGTSVREPRVEKGSTGYVAGVTDVPNGGRGTRGYSPAADVTLCWGSWWGYARAVAASRLAGGIHIPIDNARGLALGVRAADEVYEWVMAGMP